MKKLKEPSLEADLKELPSGSMELAVIEPDETIPVSWLPADLIEIRGQKKNPAVKYINGLGSDDSRRTMKVALRAFICMFDKRLVDPKKYPEPWKMFPWEMIDHELLETVKGKLSSSKTRAPSHSNKILTAAKRVMQEAWKSDIIKHEEYMRIKAVGRVRGSRVPKGRMLKPEEIQKLLSACDIASPQGSRNWAMIFVLWGGGFRRAEVASMDVDSIDRDAMHITVIGKRNKERSVPISLETLKAIDGWLAMRGTDPGPLFMPMTRNGRIFRRRMSSQTLYMYLYRVRLKLGMKAFSPHDFRRTFISEMIDQSGDIASVAKMVGHDDINTTKIYDLRDQKTQHKMVDARKMNKKEEKPE